MIMYKQMGVNVGNKIKTLFVVEMYTVLWPFTFLDKLFSFAAPPSPVIVCLGQAKRRSG
jgi:hypothetical protein